MYIWHPLKRKPLMKHIYWYPMTELTPLIENLVTICLQDILKDSWNLDNYDATTFLPISTYVITHCHYTEHIGRLVRMSVLYLEVDGSNPGRSMLCSWARLFIRIASVESAVKWVPGGDILVKNVQCYEIFWGTTLENHAYLFFIDSATTTCVI